MTTSGCSRALVAARRGWPLSLWRVRFPRELDHFSAIESIQETPRSAGNLRILPPWLILVLGGTRSPTGTRTSWPIPYELRILDGPLGIADEHVQDELLVTDGLHVGVELQRHQRGGSGLANDRLSLRSGRAPIRPSFLSLCHSAYRLRKPRLARRMDNS